MFLEDKSRRRRGRKRTASRGRYRVDSRMRGKSGKKKGGAHGMYRVGAVALLLFVIAGLFAALFAGAVLVKDVLFVNNDRFLIRKIEIVDGQIKTENMIREYLAYEGIDIGANMFSFNISDFEDLYLERNPLVKMIQVTRLFPDRLRVVIRERDPLARLGQRGTLVADSNGFVFRLSSKLHRLPVIIGCKDPELAPGEDVRGMTMRAVEVLSFCDNPRVGVRVVGIDVSNDDYLLMHIFTPNGIKKSPFTWDDMERGIMESKRNLQLRLNQLKQSIKNDRGRHDWYDATYPGRIHVR